MIEAVTIKAEELRKGNLVLIRGKIWRIEEIMFYNVRVAREIGVNVYDEEIAPYEDLSPIHLSPEILDKVNGCYCISDSPYRTTWDIDYGFGRYIHLVRHKVDKGWEVTFVNSIVLRSPHLHILQNVIFFNWGKELEITL